MDPTSVITSPQHENYWFWTKMAKIFDKKYSWNSMIFKGIVLRCQEELERFRTCFRKFRISTFSKKKFLWSKSTSAIPKIGLIKYSDDLIMLWSNSIQECNSWIHDCILYALSRVFHFFCLHTTWYQIVLAWVGFQRGAILTQTAPTKVKLISEIGITGGSLLLEWLGMGWEITNGSKSLRLNEKQHRIRLRPVGNSSRVSKLIEENPIIR